MNFLLHLGASPFSAMGLVLSNYIPALHCAFQLPIVVSPPSILSILMPIMWWKSPGWITSDSLLSFTRHDFTSPLNHFTNFLFESAASIPRKWIFFFFETTFQDAYQELLGCQPNASVMWSAELNTITIPGSSSISTDKAGNHI